MNTLNSEIKTVTVFKDRAMVTRSSKVKVDVGEHTYIFDFLPKSIIEKSIQVNGKGDVLLKDIKFSTVYYEYNPDKDLKSLEDDLQKIEYSVNEIDDKISQALGEKEFVTNISKKITSDNKKNAFDLDSEKWAKIVSFYRSKLEHIDKEIREAKKEKKIYESKIQKIKNEINQTGRKEQRSKFQVTVQLYAEKKTEVELNLSYIVLNAGWSPYYDLRVSSETKKMELQYNALISQNTSENWENIDLKLSTAQVQISGIQPQLQPWYLSQYVVPVAMPGMVSKKEISEKRKAKSEYDDMDEMIYEGAPAPKTKIKIPDTKVDTQATSVVFVIDGKNSISSDNQPKSVCIFKELFSAQFKYSSTPKLSPFAYLKVKVKNETEFPFLAGETNIFFDNNFVSNAFMDLVVPSEEFWTSLGIDESIKIKHKLIKRFEKDEGLFTKKKKMIYEYLFEIKNNKKTSEEIIISDQIPISQHEDIIIELIEPKYKENTETLKKTNQSFIEWHLKLELGEEIKIPFKFSIEFPRDMHVTGI